MKIKNSEVVKFLNGVDGISQKKLPIKLGYAITKNTKAFNEIATAYESERMKILNKFAQKEDNGDFTVVDQSYVITDQDTYGKEMAELLAIENEVELQVVNFSELEKCDSAQFDALSVQDISLLEFMTE